MLSARTVCTGHDICYTTPTAGEGRRRIAGRTISYQNYLPRERGNPLDSLQKLGQTFIRITSMMNMATAGRSAAPMLLLLLSMIKASDIRAHIAVL